MKKIFVSMMILCVFAMINSISNDFCDYDDHNNTILKKHHISEIEKDLIDIIRTLKHLKCDERKINDLILPIYSSYREYNIDYKMIIAVIHVESKFNMKAVSHKGAVGLMQLMPSTAYYICEEVGGVDRKTLDLTNPYDNIRLGTYYLARLMEDDKFEFGNWEMVLLAYNQGPTRTMIEIRNKIKSKNTYPQKVLKIYDV